MQEFSRKVRCDIFKKIANRAFIAFAGKDFLWRFRENFWGNCFLEKSGEVDYVWREIFMTGISWRGWKPSEKERVCGG